MNIFVGKQPGAPEWNFFRDPDGQWKWRRRINGRWVFSSSGFHSKAEGIASAREFGFGSVAHPRERDEHLAEERAIALGRAAFEAAIVRIRDLVWEKRQVRGGPTCFISYAWGNGKHQQWVLGLALDLRKAGIDVWLDRWHNPPGTSISQFAELILKAEFALVVGTPLLKEKYENTSANAMVAEELRMINTRLRQRGKYGEKVIPLLLEGSAEMSLTPFLQDVVYVDFRQEQLYFYYLFGLIVRLYQIGFDHPVVVELQNSLKR